jgi:hypothetical protein
VDSIRPAFLEWRTCARLCWARARQGLRHNEIIQFPTRPPRGDFWIFKIGFCPFSKNLAKKRF